MARAAVWADLDRWPAAVVVPDPDAARPEPWRDGTFGPGRAGDGVRLRDVRQRAALRQQ